MNQTGLNAISSPAFRGAAFMVLAGLGFTLVNVVTQHVTMNLGLPPTADAFWQYGFALLFSLPVVVKAASARLRRGGRSRIWRAWRCRCSACRPG